MTDWIDYIPELHSKILSKAYEDYKQLGEAYPNANKFFSTLKDNISKNVPSNEDFKSPEKMAEWSQAAAFNAPMLGTVGKLPKTKSSRAHALAQKHAALPREQGGLGLPPNNTAIDRALALGFDTDVYHGSDADLKQFSKKYFGKNFSDPVSQTSILTTKNPSYANDYGNIVYPLKIQSKKITETDDNEIRNLLNDFEYDTKQQYPEDYGYYLDKAYNDENMNKGLQLGLDQGGEIISYPGGDYGNSEISIKNPKNIRSRFAAFDPFKKDSANILASTLAGTALAKYFIDDDEWEDYTP